MTRLLLVLPLVFFSALANSQSAPKSVVAGGDKCPLKVTRSLDQQEYALPQCLVPVYTSDVVDALSNRVNGLDAQVHATIDKRFDDLTPKLVNQVNTAVAKKQLTTDQVQALKSELRREITSDLDTQLRDMKAQILALKTEVESLKGH
jgi:hypothetical protein